MYVPVAARSPVILQSHVASQRKRHYPSISLLPFQFCHIVFLLRPVWNEAQFCLPSMIIAASPRNNPVSAPPYPSSLLSILQCHFSCSVTSVTTVETYSCVLSPFTHAAAFPCKPLAMHPNASQTLAIGSLYTAHRP